MVSTPTSRLGRSGSLKGSLVSLRSSSRLALPAGTGEGGIPRVEDDGEDGVAMGGLRSSAVSSFGDGELGMLVGFHRGLFQRHRSWSSLTKAASEQGRLDEQ